MASLVTEAIVLHAFDYLESSRILRLLTRDAGIQSVLARGARTSRRRFGAAVDVFAQGIADILLRPGRELQTLAAFDIGRARPQFALDVGRFTAGSMIAELALRTASEDAPAGFFDAVEQALDALAAANPERTVEAALAGAWQIVATLGFTPAVDICANCHAALDADASAVFSHRSGGALCKRCGALAPGSRTLPATARRALRSWLSGENAESLDEPSGKAHQRLLREFTEEHLAVDRELKAYRVWEKAEWTAA